MEEMIRKMEEIGQNGVNIIEGLGYKFEVDQQAEQLMGDK